jgi:hypothetical protein
MVLSYSASAETLTINPWDSPLSPGWLLSSLLVYDPLTDTPDPLGAIRFTYLIGYIGGSGGQGVAEYAFPDQQEFWYAHWFKYAPNWQWHPDTQKITYVCNGACLNEDAGNFYVGVTGAWHPEGVQKLWMVNQITWGPGTQSFLSNTGYNPTILAGQWYWLEVHAKMNTPGQPDGLIEVWLNDQLVMKHTTVPYRSAEQIGTGFGLLNHNPIWGGTPLAVKAKIDYFWIDRTIISTTPLVDTIPPSAPRGLKVE